MVKFIYLSAIVFAASVWWVFPAWTVDDAFITARYARNLADHGELTWNVGEPPVEGYTGVLLPLVEAAAIRLGGDPILTAKALGLLGLFLTAVLTAACLRRFGCREPIPAAGWATVLTAPFFFTHATSGLETMLFSAAVCGAVWALLRAAENETAAALDESVFALAVLVAGLIRPEGAILGPIFGSALLLARWMGDRSGVRATALRLVLFYLVPAAGYFVWRVGYYGELLPNTFYAKSYEGWINPSALRSFGRFAYAFLAIPILAALGFGLLHSQSEPRTASTADREPAFARRLAMAAALIYLLLVNFQYLRSQMIMNYSFRFFAPSYPLWLILIGAGMVRVNDSRVSFQTLKLSTHRLALIFVVALAGLQLLVNAYGLRSEIDEAKEYAQVLEDEHVEAARFLSHAVPGGERLSVYMDAGVIPYLTGLPTVDFGRLNDAHLARKVSSQAGAVDYFFERNPAAAVFTTHDWNRIDYTPEAEAIAADSRFARYRLVKKLRTTRTEIRQRYHQFVYLRDDIAQARGIASVPKR